MNLSISATSAEISANGYKSITVDIANADTSDVLNHFDVKDAVDHFEASNLLDYIGEDEARKHFGITNE